MSALGAAPDAPSEYLRSKAAGEDAVHAQASSGMHVTSFRPSVVFGPGDGLFPLLARALRSSPLILPLAGADARLSPVYINDVSAAIANCIDNTDSYTQRYDLCGPQRYTLIELARYVAEVLALKRQIIALPDALGHIQAQLLELIPGSPLTVDSLRTLQADSECADDGLQRLGITPTHLESVVPDYLSGGRGEQRHRELRATAGR
jgi:uncharacterized protein YbjT (DUF2867 family)